MDYAYCRVSTDDQEAENQVINLKRLYPDAIFVIEVESAKKIRPKLEDLLEILKDGDRLIVWRLDRLSRNLVEMVTVYEDLEKRGVTIHAQTQGWANGDKDSRKLMINIYAAIAQDELRMISVRTKDAHRAKVEKNRLENESRAKNGLPPIPMISPEEKERRKHSKGGRTEMHRSKKMVARLLELKRAKDNRGNFLTYGAIIHQLAYENPKWKIAKSSARDIYNRNVLKSAL